MKDDDFDKFFNEAWSNEAEAISDNEESRLSELLKAIKATKPAKKVITCHAGK